MAAAADLLHDKMHLFSACLTIIWIYGIEWVGCKLLVNVAAAAPANKKSSP